MSYFAKLRNNTVVDVIAASQEFVNTLDGTWVQTTNAGIGYTYDPVNNVFYPAKPYPSWTLNNVSWEWESPKPYPTDGKAYKWDEVSTNWQEISWA